MSIAVAQDALDRGLFSSALAEFHRAANNNDDDDDPPPPRQQAKKRKVSTTATRREGLRAAAYLGLANCHLGMGQVDCALRELRRAASAGGGGDGTTEEDELVEAREVSQYTLALLLSQTGRHSEADENLRKLGFRFKLSLAVLQWQQQRATATASHTEPEPPSSSSCVALFDNALPSASIEYLRRVFSPTAPFWSDHGYHSPAGVGYFSYYFPLVAAGEAAPRTGIEEIILSGIWPLVCRQFPQAERAVGAEWWAHCRAHTSGHQLHFDTNEARLRRGDGLHCPVVSTVLYIDPGAGAPTLVVNQRFGDRIGDNDNDGWLALPTENRLAAFDGSLLHGVPPSLNVTDGSACAARRLTFMVGFWLDDSRCSDDELASAGPIGPNRPLPPCPPGVGTDHWCHRMADRPRPAVSPLAHATSKAPREVSPVPVASVWDRVSGTSGASSSSSREASSVDFVGRYFVRDEDEINTEIRDLLEGSSRQLVASLLASGLPSAMEALLEETCDDNLCEVFRSTDGAVAAIAGAIAQTDSVEMCEAATGVAWNLLKSGAGVLRPLRVPTMQSAGELAVSLAGVLQRTGGACPSPAQKDDDRRAHATVLANASCALSFFVAHERWRGVFVESRAMVHIAEAIRVIIDDEGEDAATVTMGEASCDLFEYGERAIAAVRALPETSREQLRAAAGESGGGALEPAVRLILRWSEATDEEIVAAKASQVDH